MTGAAVFFMRLDREGEDTRREAGAQALALPVLGGGTRVIETIRWDLAQARHVEDSAAAGRPARGGARGPRDDDAAAGAARRRCACWRALNMPAVLFEMGYLTNAEQEKARHRRRTAQRSCRRCTTRSTGSRSGRRARTVRRAGSGMRRTRRSSALAGFAGAGAARPGVSTSGSQYLGRTRVARRAGGRRRPPPAPTAHITATLFYGARDGLRSRPCAWRCRSPRARSRRDARSSARCSSRRPHRTSR